MKMLLAVLISVLPALLLRFAIIRKPMTRKTALWFTLGIFLLSWLPGAGILHRVFGIGYYWTGIIVSNTLLWSYPILRFRIGELHKTHGSDLPRIPLPEPEEKSIARWRP